MWRQLPTLGGGSSHALGQITGTYRTAAGPHGFLWQNGHRHDISVRGGPDSPVDINNRGQIVGTVTMPDGNQQAALFS